MEYHVTDSSAELQRKKKKYCFVSINQKAVEVILSLGQWEDKEVLGREKNKTP